MAISPFRERQIERRRGAEARRNKEKQASPSIFLKVATIWKVGVSSLVTAIPVLVVVTIVVSALKSTVSLETISTPKSMSDAGLTANVAALRLRDAIQFAAADEARSGESLPDIVQQADLPDMVVPTVGISVQTLATDIGTFLGVKSHRRITGDISTRDGKIHMALRLDGSLFFTSQGTFSESEIDKLIQDASRASLKIIRPIIFGVLRYRHHHYNETIEVTTEVISSGERCSSLYWRMVDQTSCHDVVVAHNLRGLALYQQGRCQEAEIDYQKTLALDPTFTWAYVDYGLVLQDMDRWPEATAVYKEAIRRDPGFFEAHISLGQALTHQGNWPEALVAFKSAKALNPRFKIPSAPDAVAAQEARELEFPKCLAASPAPP